MAAAAIGSAQEAIDQTVLWLQRRMAFGGHVGRFTHLQQELARHTARLHMGWLLVSETARRLDERLPASADAAMAKAEATEVALAAADWAMRVHGARGHTADFDLQHRVRDLMALRIADGTTDVLRGQVARSVTGDDLYDESLGRQAPLQRRVVQRRRYW